MYLPRYLTTLFLCAAGKRNHNLTKIPTCPLHTYCQVAVNRHIQMPASTGKQLNPYAWKQYTPLWSYHSSPKNMAPYLDDYKKEELFKAIGMFLDTHKNAVNARFARKMTPFLHAAKEGSSEILRLLKERGADVYATDNNGNNALHFACQMGRIETTNWLLNNCNMNLEARGSFGMTPFLFAAENGHLDILKLLKAYKADVNAEDEYGDNALHFACCSSLGSVEMVTWLLNECKIDKEAKGQYEKTPFLSAAEKGQLEIAKLLKERGADINAKNEYGNNALNLADSKNVKMITWLSDECKLKKVTWL